MKTVGEKYGVEYEELLRSVVEADVLDGRQAQVAMWPMRGARYINGGMLVGRAVNGWSDTDWRVRDGETAAGRRRIVERTRANSEPADGCPLAWVGECWGAPRGTYNSKLSAFWRTARAVFAEGGDLDWPSRLCWSNLYKVAPSAGGNPSRSARAAQVDAAARLLRHEVGSYKPRRLLVLTGRDWFEPFAERLALHVAWTRGLVEGHAIEGGRTWVIAKHPQGKDEARLAARVRELFGS
jgi:hypothetical protein